MEDQPKLLPCSTSEIRGTDCHGSGAFGARRGPRTHKGIDLVCSGGTEILSCCDGVISRCAGRVYASPDKMEWKYVEVTDDNGIRIRYMYVKSWDIELGQKVNRGDMIGVAQGVETLYEGITPHIHFETMINKMNYLNPNDYLKELDDEPTEIHS